MYTESKKAIAAQGRKIRGEDPVLQGQRRFK